MASVSDIERVVKQKGDVLTIHPRSTAQQAAHKMFENKVGCLVIVDQRGHLQGILSERDIVRQVVAAAKNPAAVTVGSIMTREVVSCNLATPLSQARQLMAQHGVRHLPIVEGGVPVGMISSRDV
ncbi:hypothetical protein LCGC14_2076140, partial [marine sediment metagenome]